MAWEEGGEGVRVELGEDLHTVRLCKKGNEAIQG